MSERSFFTHADVEQILRVVDRLSDVEIIVETGDLKLHVRKGGAMSAAPIGTPALPAVAPQSPPRGGNAAQVPARAAAAAQMPADGVVIRAPMLGTFYRAPSPTEPPFVEVGAHIGPGDPMCIIEVMKLFNTVSAQMAGTIVEICAENGAMVEYNQPLFVLRPEP